VRDRRRNAFPAIGERRRFLELGALGLALACAPSLAPARAIRPDRQERALSFYHLHTGETLNVVYWAEGSYLGESLTQINHVLRDHRTNETSPIDPGLLDLLHRISSALDTVAPFGVISGYRSPATNAMLAAHSEGVARHSLHMEGEAIDIRMPGRELEQLRRAAMTLKGGGVGYYPKSGFIHVDVGRVRYW
jgi:uncharacterized protein YcbK (DUF882 family)